MNKTHEQLRKSRGDRYGSFETQVREVSHIVTAMTQVYIDKNDSVPDAKLITEWYYLAIKLARIPASVDYADSYDDLSVYSQLIKENNCDSE